MRTYLCKTQISSSSRTATEYFPKAATQFIKALIFLVDRPNQMIGWFVCGSCQIPARWQAGRMGNTWQLAAISAPPVNLSSDLLPPPFPPSFTPSNFSLGALNPSTQPSNQPLVDSFQKSIKCKLFYSNFCNSYDIGVGVNFTQSV